jgi:hypothetical protein
MQRLVEAEREQSVLNEAETFAGVTENEILLFRNQLKVVDDLALAHNLLLCSETNTWTLVQGEWDVRLKLF